MGRRDYLDDPDAPNANSLVPAASVIVTDAEGRILLHRRRDNNRWALPGGQIGESIADCARREVREETGLTVEIAGIVGIYSDPRHVFAYEPNANSLVPAASVIVTDAEGRILLHRRRDNNRWALPGGQIGESIADCARREVREETGLTVEIAGIVGIYSDPRHVFAYDDGEVRQEFSICVRAQILEGAIGSSEESYEVAFFDPSAISDLEMVDSIRRRIDDYLDGDGPVIR